MIFGLDHLGRVYELAVRDYVAALRRAACWWSTTAIAPEHPHPDAGRGLLCGTGMARRRTRDSWALDPGRIAVMGDSAGGGLAAGVCLLARDRNGPAVAQQLLIYPMLDDRPRIRRDPAAAVLDVDLRRQRHRLGAHCSATTPGAERFRRTPLRPAPPTWPGLPDTYIDVGDLDIFRDEDIAMRAGLSDAGVPTEFHLHPGCPHAFEALARGADVSRRAIDDRIRRLLTL